MTKKVLFIQGAGEEGYRANKKLADNLSQALGTDYQVQYPKMPDPDHPDYAKWQAQISQEISKLGEAVILVGHSLGGSMLLKYLCEEQPPRPFIGLFLIATPFWSAEMPEYALPQDFAARLPEELPLFFYHNRDDEEAPFAHLAVYAEKLPNATIRQFATGGHQFNNDLSAVARDIIELSVKN